MRDLFFKLFSMSFFDTGIQITPFSPAHIVYIALIFGGTAAAWLALRKKSVHTKEKFLRLLAYPVIVLLIFKFTGAAALVPDGAQILLVSLLAVGAPSATMVVQMSQLYSDEGEYASAINVISTLLCILTMPIIILLYQL